MKVAHLSGQPEASVTFSDGLGVRVAALSEAGERLERFTLPEAFVPVQKAVQERVSRLQNLHHVRFARLRGFETAPRGGAPVVISSATDGRRLSDVLMYAAHGLLTIDIGPALQVTRELLAALAVLHDSRNVTHGSIAPERIVLGQNGRVVVVEHVLSQALDRLHLPRHQLWRDWRIATPPAAGPVRFDTRTDLAQTGVAVLALLLGRPVEEDEYPHRLRGLLPLVRDRLAQGGANRVARELQQWLERLLPSDGGRPFASVKEAQLAFEALVSSPASSLGMSPGRVKALLAACAAFDSGPADASARFESDTKETSPSAARVGHSDDVDIEALLRLAAELDAASDAQLASPRGSDSVPEPASSSAMPLAVDAPGVGLDALASERVSLHQQFADLLAQVAPEPTEVQAPEPTSLVQDAIRWTFEPVGEHDRNADVPWHDTQAGDVLPVESSQPPCAPEVTGVDAWLLAEVAIAEAVAPIDLAADDAVIAPVVEPADVAPADVEAVAVTSFVGAAPADAFDAPDALALAAADQIAAAPEIVDALVVDVPDVVTVIAVPDDHNAEVVATTPVVDVESHLDDVGAPPADAVLFALADRAADEAAIAEVVEPVDVVPADADPADADAVAVTIPAAAEPTAAAPDVVDALVTDVAEVVTFLAVPEPVDIAEDETAIAEVVVPADVAPADVDVVAGIAEPDDDSAQVIASSEAAPVADRALTAGLTAAAAEVVDATVDVPEVVADIAVAEPVEIAEEEAAIVEVVELVDVAPADVEAVAVMAVPDDDSAEVIASSEAARVADPALVDIAEDEIAIADVEPVDVDPVDVEAVAVMAVPDDDSVEVIAPSEAAPPVAVVVAAPVADVEALPDDATALPFVDVAETGEVVVDATEVGSAEAGAPTEQVAEVDAPYTLAQTAAEPTDVLSQDVEGREVPGVAVVSLAVSAAHEPETQEVAQEAIAGLAKEKSAEPVASQSAKRRRSRRKSRRPLDVADAPPASAPAPVPAPMPAPVPALAPTPSPAVSSPRASLIERDVPAWQPPADLRSVVADAARRAAAAASVASPPVEPPAQPPAVFALLPAHVEAEPTAPAAPLALPPAATVVADLMTAEPVREPEPRSRTIVVLTQQINWRRTAAAAVLIALLETAAFGAAWWWVKPGAKGTLVVETSVPGVEVLLDGALVGHTPFNNEVRPGRHTLTLRRGGLERSMPVEINLGVVTTQTLPWPRPTSGALRVTSAPEGAEVVIGGKVLGRTPLTIDDLSEGRQTLVLRSPSGTVSAAATVVAGETAVVDVPIFAGWVQVHAAVELVVSIDGTRVGTNVDGQFLLAPGTHRVDVSNAALGFTASLNATVEPGKVRSLTVRLPEVPLLATGADGAEVFVDGVSRGVLPEAAVTVPLGTHEVVLRSADGSERRRTLTVRAGAPVSFD